MSRTITYEPIEEEEILFQPQGMTVEYVAKSNKEINNDECERLKSEISRLERLSYAMKIQALWRGYVCRKNMKKQKKEKVEDKPKEKLLKDGSRRKKRNDWTISVYTEEESGFDFTYTRHFTYETYKTTYGYRFYFKNKKDYDTARDMTMYNMIYKDTKLYKWKYEC